MPAPTAAAVPLTPQFDRVATTAEGAARLEGIGPTNSLYRFDVSTNLTTWTECARLIPAAGAFRLPMAMGTQSSRFYRLATSALTDEDDWKNQIAFPGEPFLGGGEGTDEPVRWVKFVILSREPGRVHFQDSTKYVLHYDFARARLPGFQGLSREAFDAVSLHRANQEAILGTVLFPPTADVREFAIQFAGQEGYPAEWVAEHFATVRAALDAEADVRAFYFPAFEQTDAARAAQASLQARGILLSDVRRWVSGDQVYAAGWAVGRLRFVAATDLATAYAEGRLRPDDILLTEAVPAEVPFVAGILSLSPATPNSHAALFAAAADIPFGYTASTNLQARLMQWDGHDVVLRCGLRYGYSDIVVLDVQEHLDAATRAQLRQLKTPAPVDISPMTPLGALSASAEALTPADRRYFGGKASNYGLLRRRVPAHCEPAIAFSFDLWAAFLDQTLPTGGTLRQAIADRLAPFSRYPPDIAALQVQLAAIRTLITKQTAFTPQQQQAITNALSGFDPTRNLRFRSSSNAEDAKTFVAAGLYDSFSGCLLDDLDADTTGPSQCDPTEPNERGVFRAIRKVYASFYNDNAFLERLRHGIDETEVGMALLVHPSTPDQIEMANGVATLRQAAGGFGFSELSGRYVTQLGAVPVTNPEGNAQPEIVDVAESGSATLVQRSSLVPLGTTVLTWDSDYATLFALMQSVYDSYVGPDGLEPAAPCLDFEYKKVQPGRLILKQVRELPSDDPRLVDPFLVNQPATYWVFNHEQSDDLADHRLKCWLTLETSNVRLTGTNLDQCFYTQARFECCLGGTPTALTGPPATWPGAEHTVAEDPSRGRVVRDRWILGTGVQTRVYVLTTAIPTVDSTAGLVVTARDLKKWLDVTYATPMPTLDWQANPATTLHEDVQLVACPDTATLTPGEAQTYQVGALSVTIAFVHSTDSTEAPLPGVDPNLWGSFPAYRPSWAHATLCGLLPEPITLRGYYATTGVLGHKERYEWHVFEPALDPALPDAQRDALAAANIRLLRIERAQFGSEVTARILGVNAVWRPL